MLPPWLGKTAKKFTHDVGDSIHTAPGWRLVSADFYTMVEQPDCPRDPNVLRAIHEFDPGAIPLVRKQVYLPPGSTVPFVAVHHVIGRYVPTTSSLRVPFYVETAPGHPEPKPNILDYIHEDKHAPILMKAGGPPPYRPFDEELVKILRERYVDGISVREYLGRVEREKARREAAKATVREEMEYRQRALEKRLGDRIANLTMADYHQYRAEILARRAPKPRVFFGKGA